MAAKKPGGEEKSEKTGPSFERTLERLEAIVHRLEVGQPGLDEALAQYEEGVKLLRRAHRLLGQAQRRIELLSGLDPQGNPVTRPLDEDDLSADESLTEKAQRRGRRRSASPPSSGPSSARRADPPDEGPLMDDPDGLF